MGSRRARSRSAERLGAIRRPCRGIRAPSRQPRWQGVRDTGAVGEARPNRHCRLHSGRLLSLDGGCGSALGDGLPSPAARPSRADQAASQWASRRALGSVHVGASRQAVDLAARADADRQRVGGGAVPRPAPPRQADQGRVQEERGAGRLDRAARLLRLPQRAAAGRWRLARPRQLEGLEPRRSAPSGAHPARHPQHRRRRLEDRRAQVDGPPAGGAADMVDPVGRGHARARPPCVRIPRDADAHPAQHADRASVAGRPREGRNPLSDRADPSGDRGRAGQRGRSRAAGQSHAAGDRRIGARATHLARHCGEQGHAQDRLLGRAA